MDIGRLYTCNKTADERPNLFYAITNPNSWRGSLAMRRRVLRAFEQAANALNSAENRVFWGGAARTRPRLKKFLSEVATGLVPTTWWTREFAGDNQEAPT